MHSASRTVMAVALLGLAASSCSVLDPSGGSSYEPVWITASWVVRAPNDLPGDRSDREPEEWKGTLCPASSVILTNTNHESATFTIKNNCTSTVSYALCINHGSDTQRNELGLCATDPLVTSFEQLTFTTLTPGPFGNFYNSTRILTVQVFYCSSELQLSAPPISDKIECIGAE